MRGRADRAPLAESALENRSTPAYSPTLTITLPDDPALQHLDEAQVRLELACGLFASGRISRGVCARIAGLDRAAFDEALYVRHIPSYTSAMLDQDLAAWQSMKQE